MYSIYSADSKFVLQVEKKAYDCITFFFPGKFSEIPAMGAIRARVQVRYYCISCVKYNQICLHREKFIQMKVYQVQALWAPKFYINYQEDNQQWKCNCILMIEIDSFQSNGEKYFMLI